ncbi:hypothetical protein BJX65DRAFT_272153 [Aspergillus insuetus]
MISVNRGKHDLGPRISIRRPSGPDQLPEHSWRCCQSPTCLVLTKSRADRDEN